MKKEECIMKKRWIAVFCAVLLAMLAMTTANTKAAAKTGVWGNKKKEVQDRKSTRLNSSH